jgi:hypothetical protein
MTTAAGEDYENEKILYIVTGSTRFHSEKSSLWKRLRTYLTQTTDQTNSITCTCLQTYILTYDVPHSGLAIHNLLMTNTDLL